MLQGVLQGIECHCDEIPYVQDFGQTSTSDASEGQSLKDTPVVDFLGNVHLFLS